MLKVIKSAVILQQCQRSRKTINNVTTHHSLMTGLVHHHRPSEMTHKNTQLTAASFTTASYYIQSSQLAATGCSVYERVNGYYQFQLYQTVASDTQATRHFGCNSNIAQTTARTNEHRALTYRSVKETLAMTMSETLSVCTSVANRTYVRLVRKLPNQSR